MPRLDSTSVFLLRHGESTFNEQGRCQGCSDESVLTEKGVRTAGRTGAHLRSQPPKVILASPLKRARQTAEIILSGLKGSGVTLEFHESLKEVDLPLWEGLTYDQIRTNFGRHYQTWKGCPHLLRMGQIRPVSDLYRRAARFWREVLPRWAGTRVLIVSHGGTTRGLIGSALGIPAKFYHRTQHSNGGLSILEFEGVRVKSIEALNLTGHLGQVLPKLKEGKRGVRLVLLPLDRSLPPAQRLLDELKADFVTSAEGLNAKHLSASDGAVRTGVVMAPVDSLLPVLMTTIGARQSDSARWAMRHGHVSILHYPEPVGGGVLQAFNFPVSAKTGARSDL